jgi:CubicO group peptidase (beta-lactamase class C family)
MRHRTLLVAGLLVLPLAILIIVRVLSTPLLHPALGFAAKVTCSGVLAGGATVTQVADGFPDERLRALVRVQVDEAAGTVTASVPLLARRRAVHRPGLGCTLDPAGDSIRALAGAAVLEGIRRGDLPWPEGEAAVAMPAEIDGERLAAVVDGAFMEDPDRPPRRTLAVVVIHNGRLLAERYAAGYGPDHRLAGWSMTKSVTNALAGILAGEGRLDMGAAGLRREWQDDARRGITLGELMHMSSGLEFDESYTPTGGATRMLFNSPDVAAVAAESPLVHEPGTQWSYSSGTTNLIAAHLRSLFANDAEWGAFPAERLFRPLGMYSAVMEPDAVGTFVGSSFMYATARDWARFGQLYLQDGVWNGVRLLPEGWVSYSVAPAPAAPLGRYGAHWWLNHGDSADPARRRWPELPPDIYFASGFQGQYVVVVPGHNLVIVRLGMTATDESFELGRFLRGILSAMQSPASS